MDDSVTSPSIDAHRELQLAVASDRKRLDEAIKRIGKLEAGSKPTPTTDPEQPPADEPTIDLSEFPDIAEPGKVYSVPVGSMQDGDEVWVHWFKGDWTGDVERSTVTVKDSLVVIRTLAEPGSYILQVQVPGVGVKDGKRVWIIGEPVKPVPPPVVGPVEPKPYPDPTHTIEVQGGKTTDISDRIKRGQGKINLVIGPRDAVVRINKHDIYHASIIFDGCKGYKSPRYEGAKFVEGRSSGFVWCNDFEYEGRDITDEGVDTFKFAHGFSRFVAYNSVFRKVRRLWNGNGFHEAHNVLVEDTWEDLAQGSGLIRSVTVNRMGWPTVNPPTAHPDVIQASKWDVDGLTVDGYNGIGQGIPISDRSGSGSVFKNVTLKNAGFDNRGSGVLIQAKDGVGPSDVLFENVVMDKPFKIRRTGRDRWEARNITLRNCRFSNLVVEGERVFRDVGDVTGDIAA